MDHRAFYVAGDLLANLVIGAAAGLLAWAIVSPAWNMWLAMPATMALGKIVGLVLYIPIAIKLGAQEAMIPAMYTGMWSGMVVGMMSAMMPLHGARHWRSARLAALPRSSSSGSPTRCCVA